MECRHQTQRSIQRWRSDRKRSDRPV